MVLNKITIFGMGCEATRKLEDEVYKAVILLQLRALVGRVENINAFIEHDLVKTPALMINNEIVLNGEIPNFNQLLELLRSKSAPISRDTLQMKN